MSNFFCVKSHTIKNRAYPQTCLFVIQEGFKSRSSSTEIEPIYAQRSLVVSRYYYDTTEQPTTSQRSPPRTYYAQIVTWTLFSAAGMSRLSSET